MIESLLLSVTRVSTLLGAQQLTSATGFFFERDGRLFLVTNRHVVLDEASDHRPDRLEIELHVDPENVAVTTGFAIPLYRGTQPVWREGLRPSRHGGRRRSATRASGATGQSSASTVYRPII